MEKRPSEMQAVDYYFDSYAHFGIHEDMLKDRIRTLAYKNAILTNPRLFKDKVILDVGCGTGILSMFAAKAGAKRVYAVEKSSIVDYAREIIQINGFGDVITVMQGIVEEIDLPEKVDVIISEWMGYCLLYESMLPSVINARDRFLKETGTMFPNKAQMYICGIEDAEYRSKKIDFWDNVYGFSYAPIKQWALLEPLVETCPTERIFTDECMLCDLDLNKCSIADLTITSKFTLVPQEEQMLHAFVTWFDVEFVGPDNTITLTTSPYKKETHWCQTIFYLQNPIDANPDTPITGKFHMEPNMKNPRDQDFQIEWNVNDESFSQLFKMR